MSALVSIGLDEKEGSFNDISREECDPIRRAPSQLTMRLTFTVSAAVVLKLSALPNL